VNSCTRLLLPLILGSLLAGYSCKPSPPPAAEENAPLPDDELASALGADDYGMKTYVMAFLKSGPNRSADSLERARLQRAHLDNITRLAEEGKLVLAGPFLDDGEVRGIYILDVPTLEEAEALTRSDPAIQAGSLIMELHPWYGSATLPLLQDMHAKIARKKI
jgi:uncharacterized protein YciI